MMAILNFKSVTDYDMMQGWAKRFSDTMDCRTVSIAKDDIRLTLLNDDGAVIYESEQ